MNAFVTLGTNTAMASRISGGREVQERLPREEGRFARRDELLAAHGVSIPTGRDMRPLRTVGKKRPRWLASLVRLFR